MAQMQEYDANNDEDLIEYIDQLRCAILDAYTGILSVKNNFIENQTFIYLKHFKILFTLLGIPRWRKIRDSLSTRGKYL
jgi:hypothetical protein